MASEPKTWRPPSEEPGIGMLADGTLNVVTPEEYRKRVLERDAEEGDSGTELEDEAELLDAYKAAGEGESFEPDEA